MMMMVMMKKEGGEGGGEERRGEELTLKSNNPNLTGGEKTQTKISCSYERGCNKNKHLPFY